MNKTERLLTALQGGTPDMVPFMFNTVIKSVQEGVIGHEISSDVSTYDGMNATGWLGSYTEKPQVIPTLSCVPEFAEKLNLDGFTIQVLPPLFVEWAVSGEDACVRTGLIGDEETLNKCKAAMPDPDDEKLYREIEAMISRYKGDFALGARIRLGASPAILSMGMENMACFFAMEEDEIIYNVVKMYTDWSKRVNQNLMELGFDFFWTFDDIAYTNAMMFSPDVFRRLFKPNLADAASVIKTPLIFHSDGDYSPVIEDIIDIGANAIHPLEKKAMNSKWLKDTFGSRLCMVGNVDIDHILYDASLEEVDEEVRTRMELFGPGGGYVISDSNSLPSFCSPANIIEMARAVEKYRRIY